MGENGKMIFIGNLYLQLAFSRDHHQILLLICSEFKPIN